jgi:hypothetical protein
VRDVGHEDLEAHVWKRKNGGGKEEGGKEGQHLFLQFENSVLPARGEKGQLLRKGRVGRRKKKTYP